MKPGITGWIFIDTADDAKLPLERKIYYNTKPNNNKNENLQIIYHLN